MNSAIRLAWFVAAVAILWSTRVNAVSPVINAVGVYDETAAQQNNVDFNATANAHSASTGNGAGYSTIGSFNPLVAGAFTLGHGGVVDFDALSNGTTGSSLGVSYAGGTKSFTMTFSTGYEISTGSTVEPSTPISHSNYVEPGVVSTSYSITFSPITGAPANETGLSEIGLTLLSATIGTSTPENFGGVTVTAHFSDSSTASVSRTISETKENGDTFFSILAPGGLTISSIDISAPSSANSNVPDLDDFAFITNAAGCAPAPDSMVSWWKAEGDANDSQDSNNGTLQNGATFTTGEVGQAFSLDGTDDYVEVSDSSNISFTGPFTIDAWIKTTDNTSEHGIVEKYDGGGQNGYFFRLASGTGRLVFGICNGVTCESVAGATQVSISTFHHVAAIFDGSSLKVYLDGNLDGSASTSIAPGDGTNPLEIGARGGSPGNFFSGLVDEVELFNRALSDTEVASIFAAGSAGKCSCTPAPAGMISWWPGDNNYDDVADSNNMQQAINFVGFAPGEVREAFSFSGSGYLSAGNPANLKLTGTEVTLDAWVNPTNAEENGVIAGKTESGNNDYLLYLNGGVLVGIIKAGGSESTIGGGVLPVGSWSHVALTYDGTAIKIYVNGIQIDSLPKTGNLDGTDAEVAIGGRNADDLQLVGLVDEVEVFGRALSASEIAAIYGAGGAGKCRSCTSAPAGMTHWWPANGNTEDVIGNNDGTLQSGATFGPGKVDQAFSLDGVDDYVDVGPNVNVPEKFSADVWINPTSTSGRQAIIGKTDFSSSGYEIALSDGGLTGFVITDSGITEYATDFVVVTAGTWQHVTVTYDGTVGSNTGQAFKFYVNGNNVSASASPFHDAGGTPQTSSLSATIGAAIPFGGDYFGGLIDELEIFGRVLSQSEIQKIIYDAGSAGKCPCVTPPEGMVSWWPGDDNENDIQDGNNGEEKGNSTFAPGEVGSAFSLDGVTGYVQIPDSANLSISGPISIDAWVNPNNVDNHQSIITKYDTCLGAEQRSYALDVLAGGDIQWCVYNGQPDPNAYHCVQTNTGIT
ncbi:MAG: hypothetical protein DME57_09485, partial [Verrucomicrobia bacterium]